MVRDCSTPRPGHTPPPVPPDACKPPAWRDRLRHHFAANRRSTARKPISLRVDVLPVFDTTGSPSSAPRRRGVTVDVSASGLRCSQIGYLPMGALVRLFVGLPDSANRLSCYARVVRCDMRGRPGYGLKLVGLGPSDAHRLCRLTNVAR